MCFITCNMSLVLEINYLILSYLIIVNKSVNTKVVIIVKRETVKKNQDKYE